MNLLIKLKQIFGKRSKKPIIVVSLDPNRETKYPCLSRTLEGTRCTNNSILYSNYCKIHSSPINTHPVEGYCIPCYEKHKSKYYNHRFVYNCDSEIPISKVKYNTIPIKSK
jgi:hypothetical protein